MGVNYSSTVRMRYEKGHKQETRRKVIETASRRFRRDGIAATGVASLMADAGLTHGGFYAHFASKDDLVAEAVGPSADQPAACEKVCKKLPSLETFVARYLSPAHRDHPEHGCIAAALASEIGRLSPETQARFTASLREVLAEIAQLLPARLSGKTRSDRARAIFSLMMGALQLSRAVNDLALSEGLLLEGRRAALKLAALPAQSRAVAPTGEG